MLTSVIAGFGIALAVATAISVNNASKANAETERSRITQQILVGVFQQADPFGDGASQVTLADALVSARPSIDEQVANDPQLAWEVNRTLAEIFTNLDLLDMEREALQAVWDAALKLDGDNELERLTAIAGLGNILVRTDPDEAVTFFAEHLPASPRTRRGAVEWLSAKYAEVSAHIRLRNYERVDVGAAAMARVARDHKVELPRTLGRIEQLLAGSARRAGDIDKADQHWDSAVENMRRAEVPLGLAVTLSNRALHYGMTGRYAESEQSFEESIDIFANHETDNTSHANVLRLYAGLLFRMQKPDDAIAALDDALAILDPEKNNYAYYLAQLNRANYSFANGDITTTLDAINRGSQVAVAAFGREAEVTQRMFTVLARLLLFADKPAVAASLLGLSDEDLCANKEQLAEAVDDAIVALAEMPATEAARQKIWQDIAAIRTSQSAGVAVTDKLAVAVEAYRDPPDMFLDALDRYRIVTALIDIAGDAESAPTGLVQEYKNNDTLKHVARELLSENKQLERTLALLVPDGTKYCKSF